MDDDKLNMIIYLFLGVIAGMVSFYLKNGMYSVVTTIIIAFLSGKVLERKFEDKGIKWWIGNGLFIYFFIWIISWLFLLNF